MLQTRIAAMAAKAITKIDVAKVEALTEIARDGLETTTAMAFIDRMPTPAQLMPTLRPCRAQASPRRHRGAGEPLWLMTDLLAEIRARRLAAEEERRQLLDRAAEVVAAQRAAKRPSKAALRRAAREAAARVAGWTGRILSLPLAALEPRLPALRRAVPAAGGAEARGRVQRRRQAGDRQARGTDRHRRGAARGGAAGRLA